MKPRVLFVDDEPLVLSALQRATRSMHNDCDCVFSVGALRALGYLKQDSFEVVISDMRMPEIDGVALLEKFRHETPDTVRIILSGQAGAETVSKSFAVTHQYMAKPADTEYLRTLLRSLFQTASLLSNPLVRRKISQLAAYPLCESTSALLAKMTGSDSLSYPELTSLARRDAGLIARLIHISGVNPDARQRITSFEELVSSCSNEILSRTLRTNHLFAPVSDASPLGALLRETARHQVAVAEEAMRLTAHLSAEQRNHLFLATLLHDFGKPLLAHLFPEIWQDSFQTYFSHLGGPSDAERKAFGATHGEVGGYLAALWGLPETVVKTILNHATSSEPQDELSYWLRQSHRGSHLCSRSSWGGR